MDLVKKNLGYIVRIQICGLAYKSSRPRIKIDARRWHADCSDDIFFHHGHSNGSAELAREYHDNRATSTGRGFILAEMRSEKQNHAEHGVPSRVKYDIDGHSYTAVF